MALSGEECGRIAEGWVACHRASEKVLQRAEPFWAVDAMHDLTRDAPESAWAVIQLISQLDESEWILANLAAGPLEDMMVYHGAAFIDRIERAAAEDGRMRHLVSLLWKNDISDEIWCRLVALR